DLFHRVPVYFERMETKRLEFRLKIACIQYFAHCPVKLDLVVVQYHDKVVQSPGSRKHERFPYLSFLDLTVSDYGICKVILIPAFPCQRHTDRRRKPLSKRTCRHVHA